MIAKLEEAKKVITRNEITHIENGYLVELFKDVTGRKTEAYLTVTKPGAFKGYHLHTIREARYVCLKGKIKVTLYIPGSMEKEEHILDANNLSRLYIPKNVATGLLNIGEEDAWVINYPNPAYDPDLKGEQIEYTEEELLKGIIK